MRLATPARGGLRALMVVGWAAALGVGCDLDAPEAPPLVPLELREVRVTAGYDSAGRPERVRLAQGSLVEGVATTTSIIIELSGFVLPASATRQAICLRPSTDPVAQLDDCSGPSQPFFAPDYRPSSRRLTFYQLSGERLAPETFYRLTVYPPTPDADWGLRAFDGAPLDAVYQYDFVTGSDDPPIEETGPTPARYCAVVSCGRACRLAGGGESSVQQCLRQHCGCLDEECFADGDVARSDGGLFAQSCSGGGCHGTGQPPPAEGWGAGDVAMGLDLSTPDAIDVTAMGRAAHETQTGEHAAQTELSPSRFGRSMPIICPGSPGESYLVYKAAVQLLNHPPAHQLDAEFVAEIDRLRSAAVPGAGMPPSDSLVGLLGDPNSQRSWHRLQLLEAWIAHGAVTSCP